METLQIFSEEETARRDLEMKKPQPVTAEEVARMDSYDNQPPALTVEHKEEETSVFEIRDQTAKDVLYWIGKKNGGRD